MARGAPSKAMKPSRALYYYPSISSRAAKIFSRFAGAMFSLRRAALYYYPSISSRAAKIFSRFTGAMFSLRRAALWGRLQPATGFQPASGPMPLSVFNGAVRTISGGRRPGESRRICF